MAEQGPETTAHRAWERLGQLTLALLFLLALSGGIALVVQRQTPKGIEVVLPTATAQPSLQVYLSGAVTSPGVYSFEDGERLGSLLERAGGPAENADLAKTNLALRLQDEDHIRIPQIGEASQPQADASRNSGPGLLDLNAATQAELEQLPGIGVVRASAIIEYRELQGSFRTLADLLQVPGIGPSTLAGIADRVTVDQ